MTAISNTLTIDYMLHSMPRGSFWRFISVWFSKILGVAILRHMSGWNGPVFRYKIANFNGEHTCQWSTSTQKIVALLLQCSSRVHRWMVGGSAVQKTERWPTTNFFLFLRWFPPFLFIIFMCTTLTALILNRRPMLLFSALWCHSRVFSQANFLRRKEKLLQVLLSMFVYKLLH